MASPATTPDPALRCDQHPAAAAQWRCSFCHATLCPECVRRVTSGAKELVACQACGGRCEPLSPGPPTPTPAAPLAGRATASDLQDALSYPLRSHGPMDLALTVAFLLLGDFVVGGVAPLGGGIAGGIGKLVVVFIVMLIVWAGVIAFVIRILEATTGGSDESPGWPDFGRSGYWSGVIAVVATFFLSHDPVIVHWLVADPASTGYAATHWLLWLLAALYNPMALLAIVVCQTWQATLPQVVLPAIARTARGYLPCVAAWVLLGLVQGLGRTWIAGSLVGDILVLAMTVYVLMAEMRLLGLFYRRSQVRLGWV